MPNPNEPINEPTEEKKSQDTENESPKENEKENTQKNTENGEEKTEAKAKKNVQILHDVYDWIETFATAFAVVLIFFTFMLRVVTVQGSSMYPTLYGVGTFPDKPGDRLVLSDMFYTPKTGDIVVVRRENKKPIIKRIIATEGQTVDIDFDNWRVYVDGEELEEPYINRIEGVKMHDKDVKFPLTIDKDCVFVMGDNRNDSLDSRDTQIGQVNESRIVGRVLFRLYPFDRFGKVEPAAESVAAYEREKLREETESTAPQIGDNEFTASW